MAKVHETTSKKKLNIFGLISLLTGLLILPLFLIPWYRLFLLRDDSLTTLLIHIIGLFGIGLIMLVLGILGRVKNRKNPDTFNGNWMAMAGLVLGVIFTLAGGFFVADYLLFING